MGLNGNGKNVKAPKVHPYEKGEASRVIITREKGPKNSSKLFVWTGEGSHPWAEIDKCSKRNFDAVDAYVFGNETAASKAIAAMTPRNGNNLNGKNGKLHPKHQTRKPSKSF